MKLLIFVELSISLSWDQMLLELCFGGEKVRYVRYLKFHIQCYKVCLIEGFCETDRKSLLLSPKFEQDEGGGGGEFVRGGICRLVSSFGV